MSDSLRPGSAISYCCVLLTVPLAIAYGQPRMTVVPLDTIRAGSRTAVQVNVEIGPTELLPGEQIAVQLPPFWPRPQRIRQDSTAYVSVSSTTPSAVLLVSVEGTSIDGYQSTTEVSTVRVTVGGSNPVAANSTISVRFGALPSATLGIRASRIAGPERVAGQVIRLVNGIPVIMESFSETIEVEPGAAVRAVVRLEPITADGQQTRVRVVFLDSFSNRDTKFDRSIQLVRSDGASYGTFQAAAGYFESTIWLGTVGTDSVTMIASGGIRATSNPAVVQAGTPLRIWWGDTHTHCAFSGHGAGTPYDLLRYARWSSLLDWVVYTEHDWITDALQEQSAALVNEHDVAGRFTAFQGLEWTARTPPGRADHLGHLTVIGRDSRRIVDINADRSKTPLDVFAAAATEDYILFVNHPLGDYPYDWRYFEPSFVRNVEMVSDAFIGIRSNEFAVPGKYGRSVSSILQDEFVVGFVGASDNHYSQPGISTANFRRSSGLTAVLAPDLSRSSVFDALKARHNYATTGARILLDVKAGNAIMGDVIRVGEMPDRTMRLSLAVLGESRLDLVEIVKNGITLKAYTGITGRELSASIVDSVDAIPSYYYVRVRQVDQEMAWSSPLWVLNDPPIAPPQARGGSNKVKEFISNPNPSQRAFKISFKLAESGPARLAIYDLLGRNIRTILSNDLSAGDHVAWWTSETDRGSFASTGVYFARIDFNGTVSTIRLLLVH